MIVCGKNGTMEMGTNGGTATIEGFSNILSITLFSTFLFLS